MVERTNIKIGNERSTKALGSLDAAIEVKRHAGDDAYTPKPSAPSTQELEISEDEVNKREERVLALQEARVEQRVKILSQELRDAQAATDDLNWRLNLKPYFKKILKERTARYANTKIPFIREAWPVFETVAIYLAKSTRVEFYRLTQYFADDWNKADGFAEKSFKVLKYGALIGLGVAACFPTYAPVIGLVSSMVAAVTAVNMDSKEFSATKTIAATLFGVIVGSTFGAIPVVGPGMATGLVNGTIQGIRKFANNKALDELGGHHYGALIGEVLSMSLLGLIKGIVPIFGMAATIVKLERYQTKSGTPEERNAEKFAIREDAKALLEQAQEKIALGKRELQELEQAAAALHASGVKKGGHTDHKGVLDRVIEFVSQPFRHR